LWIGGRTKKQPITNERVTAVVRARLQAQGQSLGKASARRFKFMIEAAVGEFDLAERMVKAPHPCQRPGGRKADGGLTSRRQGLT
jgi:hypothetical protein